MAMLLKITLGPADRRLKRGEERRKKKSRATRYPIAETPSFASTAFFIRIIDCPYDSAISRIQNNIPQSKYEDFAMKNIILRHDFDDVTHLTSRDPEFSPFDFSSILSAPLIPRGDLAYGEGCTRAAFRCYIGKQNTWRRYRDCGRRRGEGEGENEAWYGRANDQSLRKTSGVSTTRLQITRGLCRSKASADASLRAPDSQP
ncbi:hypothetical protein KM043_009120 [Ampulex compressa]|nr:hypothetical protein KM043_009120 [Ampulex compressa]